MIENRQKEAQELEQKALRMLENPRLGIDGVRHGIETFDFSHRTTIS